MIFFIVRGLNRIFFSSHHIIFKNEVREQLCLLFQKFFTKSYKIYYLQKNFFLQNIQICQYHNLRVTKFQVKT